MYEQLLANGRVGIIFLSPLLSLLVQTEFVDSLLMHCGNVAILYFSFPEWPNKSLSNLIGAGRIQNSRYWNSAAISKMELAAVQTTVS